MNQKGNAGLCDYERVYWFDYTTATVTIETELYHAQ